MSCAAHALALSRGFLVTEDVDLIQKCVALLEDVPFLFVVDLGAGSGTTALSVFAVRPLGTVNITTVEHSAASLNSTGVVVANVGRMADWNPILDDTIDAAPWYLAPIDLLMIDTSHEYDQTVAEIEAWLPKVTGIVWFHDYLGEYPGCRQAIDEAVARGEIEMLYQEGLGWAGRPVR